MRQLNLEILNTLHQEHMTTLALLERLETVLRRHPSKKVPSNTDEEVNDVVADVVTVMENEITGHYAFEEEHLFRGEHDTIRPIAKRLTDLARNARDSGFDQETWEEFHTLGQEIVEREIFHVQKEEMGFLPALDHMLDPADDPELVKAYDTLKAG